MEVLGIGLPELLFIVLLVLVLINPADMRATGHTIGRWMNRFIHSPTWKAMQDIQKLPTQMMREANLEDLKNELGGKPRISPPRNYNLAAQKAPGAANGALPVNVEAQGYSQNITLDAPEKDAKTGE